MATFLHPNLNKKVRTEEEKATEFEVMLKKALKNGKDKYRENIKSKDNKIGDNSFKLPCKKVDIKKEEDK